MYEEQDQDLRYTALRESEEETGLDVKKVDIIGPIDTVVSRFNISVTPYVGIVPNDIELNDSSDEIEACFKVPVSFLLQDNRFRNDEITRNGELFYMPAYKYDSYIIWGLTAMMTVDFLKMVRLCLKELSEKHLKKQIQKLKWESFTRFSMFHRLIRYTCFTLRKSLKMIIQQLRRV